MTYHSGIISRGDNLERWNVFWNVSESRGHNLALTVQHAQVTDPGRRDAPPRNQANRERGFFLPESQDHNRAMTVLHVTHSLDSGWRVTNLGRRDVPPHDALIEGFGFRV